MKTVTTMMVCMFTIKTMIDGQAHGCEMNGILSNMSVRLADRSEKNLNEIQAF